MRTPGAWQPGPGAPTYGSHNRPQPNSALGRLQFGQSNIDWAQGNNIARWNKLASQGIVPGVDEQIQDEDIQRIARDLVQGNLEGLDGRGSGGAGFGDLPPGAPGAAMPGQVNTSRLAGMGNYQPPALPTPPAFSAAADKPASIERFDPASLGGPEPAGAPPPLPDRIDPSRIGGPGPMPNLRRPQPPRRPVPPRV